MTEQAATSGSKSGQRLKRAKPIDARRLEELALAYAARFATTAARLETYLKRKLRERGFEGEDEPDVSGVVARCVAHGYVDDAIYGRARASGLLARGYGARRVEAALRGAGVGEELRSSFAPDEAARREAALTFARKRGFGPFAPTRDEPPQAARKRREKQLAATLRAGHDFAAARMVVDARAIEELEQWVGEAREELPE